MPELPEVETIRRDLESRIVGKKIDTKKIKKISRRGKLLILERENDYLLIHLGMTGQLIFRDKDKVVVGGHEWNNQPDINKFTRKKWCLADGSELLFNDARRFGYYKYVKKPDLSGYGPEALGFKFPKTDSRSRIKSWLLNQKNIAGLGNIYTDEVLFRAGIKPTRRINNLNKAELAKIERSIKYVIKKAIECRGTTFSDYRDASGRKGNYKKLLKVYGRENRICKKCKREKIKKIRLAGRGTHFCGACQF